MHGAAKIQTPAGTCLLAYRGSIAHGMYVSAESPETADIDVAGVVIPPEPRYILALAEWGSRGTREQKQGRYDCVFYEIRKAVRLLLEGNPNVLSLLWLRPEDYIHATADGRALIENRRLFVGKHVYDSFAGYAHAQLKKMETRNPAELREYIGVDAELKRRGLHPNHKGVRFDVEADPQYAAWDAAKLVQRWRSYQKKGENLGYLGEKRKRLVLEHGYDAKNAAHLIRLLRMCREFLLTGELTVWRPDAAELLEIRRGGWTLARVKAHAEDLFREITEAREKSPLPPGPDREGAERLVIRMLRARLDAA